MVCSPSLDSLTPFRPARQPGPRSKSRKRTPPYGNGFATFLVPDAPPDRSGGNPRRARANGRRSQTRAEKPTERRSQTVGQIDRAEQTTADKNTVRLGDQAAGILRVEEVEHIARQEAIEGGIRHDQSWRAARLSNFCTSLPGCKPTGRQFDHSGANVQTKTLWSPITRSYTTHRGGPTRRFAEFDPKRSHPAVRRQADGRSVRVRLTDGHRPAGCEPSY